MVKETAVLKQTGRRSNKGSNEPVTKEDDTMKKKGFAFLIAAVTIGTAVGSTAALYANEDKDTQLNIAAADSADEDTDSESADESSDESVSLPTGEIEKAELADEDNTSVETVVDNTMATLVSITNTSVTNVEDWFRGGTYQIQSQSLGTGVIMGENDTELLIVTNNHVVADASEITVTFVDESSVSAKVKGTDQADDLAVVAVELSDIDSDTLSQIKIANVADSDDVRVGEQVVAIGNALGYGQSVTTGIVSALNRTITATDEGSTVTFDDLIQTDAAINPGNSGGALMNMQGEVIGINSVKAGESGVEGMGYAISMTKALPIIETLMNRETRDEVSEEDMAYLGITGQDVTSDVSQLYSLPEGVYVTAVEDGSPAAEAGITQGMIITGFDSQKVSSLDDLQNLLQYYTGGEEVTLTVSAQSGNGGYEEQEIQITLGSRGDYLKQQQ